jgi:hypothetical protein
MSENTASVCTLARQARRKRTRSGAAPPGGGQAWVATQARLRLGSPDSPDSTRGGGGMGGGGGGHMQTSHASVAPGASMHSALLHAPAQASDAQSERLLLGGAGLFRRGPGAA